MVIFLYTFFLMLERYKVMYETYLKSIPGQTINTSKLASTWVVNILLLVLCERIITWS